MTPMHPSDRGERTDADRRRDWALLDLTPDEQDWLAKYRRRADPDPMPSHAAFVARLGGTARRQARWRQARHALAAAWIFFKLAPARMVAASLALMLVSAVAARGAPADAAALWATFAPLGVAALAWAGRMPRTGALGELAGQAPMRWDQPRVGIWIMVAAADGLATLLVRSAWPSLPLGAWWGMFLAAAAVMLWLDHLLPSAWRRWALALVVLANGAAQVVHHLSVPPGAGALTPPAGALPFAGLALAALLAATYWSREAARG